MNLSQYIETVNVSQFARKLKVNRFAVYRWKNLEGLPKSKTMHKIREMTFGAVSYEEMIDPFIEAQTKIKKPSNKKKIK